jgi:uncharacterized protein YceK
MKRVDKRLWLISIAIAILILYTVAGCSGISQNQNGSDSSNSSNTAAQTAWSPDTDCTTCHTTETASMSDSACLVSKHVAQGVTCSTCHTDNDALAAAHEDMSTAKTPTKLKKTTVDESVCLNCHDKTELAENTTNVTVCTDSQGTTVNPHDLPVNDNHATITCVDCHEMHSTDTAETLAPEKCISCHHANVYQCYTCHK